MKLTIETYQDPSDAEIAQEITDGVLKLNEIADRTWKDMLRWMIEEAEQAAFQKISTKKKIRWVKERLDNEVIRQREIHNSPDPQWIKEMLVEQSEQEKKVLYRMLSELDPKPLVEGQIGPNEISRARAVPIPNLLEIKNKKARCLWHDDSHPSLYYYSKTNTVKCFACQANEDAIGVAMKLYGLSFIDAVKKLIS